MEYLVAAHFSEEIKKNAPDAFGRRSLQPVTVEFLREFEPNTDVLYKWINKTKGANFYRGEYVGGNAATLLCALSKDALAGKDLSGTILRGTYLRLANLSKTKLKDAILNEANLAAARFSKEQLVEANLFNCTFLFLCVASTTGRVEDKLDEAADQLGSVIRIEGEWIYSQGNKNVCFICLIINVNNQRELIHVRDILFSQFDEVALYSSEYDELTKKYPRLNKLICIAVGEKV
jgi:hypothetical protein